MIEPHEYTTIGEMNADLCASGSTAPHPGFPFFLFTFNLMELCQVGGIKGFISEDPIDGEVLLGGELVLISQLMGYRRL